MPFQTSARRSYNSIVLFIFINSIYTFINFTRVLRAANNIVREHSTGLCLSAPCHTDLEQAGRHFGDGKSTKRVLSTTGQALSINTQGGEQNPYAVADLSHLKTQLYLWRLNPKQQPHTDREVRARIPNLLPHSPHLRLGAVTVPSELKPSIEFV